MGIRQGQTPAGAHLCRPGCGRCGSGGQAQGRGAGRTSGTGAAPLPRKKHCSPPRGPRSPTLQAQGSWVPPGTAGRPPYRCWGQGRGLQKTAPWPTPTRAPTARLCSPPPPCSACSGSQGSLRARVGVGPQTAQRAPHPQPFLLSHCLLPPSLSAYTPRCPRSWAWEVEAPAWSRDVGGCTRH